jgi:hypothetical protein
MATLKGPTKISSVVDAKPGSIFPGGKGSYIPFMNGGQRSWSGKSFGNTNKGNGQQRSHVSSGSPDAGCKVKEEASSDEDVLLEAVPGITEVIFPDSFSNFQLTNIRCIIP